MNSKKKINLYRLACGQIKSKVKNHIDLIATLSNTTAILKERFPNFFWVGIYFVKESFLVLGPFQGPPACMKLNKDKGACATAVNQQAGLIIPDVNLFPGHIACDKRSRSEIVIPLFDKKGIIPAVIDIDSKKPNDFDEDDMKGLEKIGQILVPIWK